MPIPSYPDNWSEIAFNLKQSNQWRCEHCGHIDDRFTGHVLTVHHLDMNPSNCDSSNLVALCQRCHLHIQGTYIPGQLFLLEVPSWIIKRGIHA